MITEERGSPNLFHDANEILMDSYVDLMDSNFDSIADCDQVEELIIRIHSYDNMRRRKCYDELRQQIGRMG